MLDLPDAWVERVLFCPLDPEGNPRPPEPRGHAPPSSGGLRQAARAWGMREHQIDAWLKEIGADGD